MIHAPQKRIQWDVVKEKLRAAQAALEPSSPDEEVRRRRVFQQRAQRLAAGQIHRQATGDTLSVLVFQNGKERCGIELRHIASVLPDARITPVPGSAASVLGVASLLGEVRSVLSLERLLGRQDSVENSSHYVLLLRCNGRQVGLRVGRIQQVRSVAVDDLTAVDDGSDHPAHHVRGVTRDHLLVLRTESLFECFSHRELQRPTPPGDGVPSSGALSSEPFGSVEV